MPNGIALKAQLRIADRATKELSTKLDRLEKRRNKLREQVAHAELKALGLVKGARYRMIQKHNPGPIMEGIFKKFVTVKWSGNRMAVFRCPAVGRFREEMRHLKVDDFEFERVNAPKKEAS